MGKNQAYKAMQRSKMSSHTAGATDEVEDGMMDGSFHSPAWHAARLASLHTSHTITWEEYRLRQKEEARRMGELEDSEARMMREYRAQLDAERASKLARGKNHASKKESSKKGKDKAKDKERERKSGKKYKKTEKKRRTRHGTDSDSDTPSEEENSISRKKRSKSRKERSEKKHNRRESRSETSSGQSSSENDNDTYGPLPLSSFFENGKG